MNLLANFLVVSFVALFSAPQACAQAEWLNVMDSGAVGNGTTDDTIAIMATFAALPSRGGVVYFPPGRYLITSKLVLPDRRVSIVGDGRGISTLLWTSVDGGLVYQPTIDASPSGSDDGRELSVSDITLRTTRAGGGSAIRAAWPETPGRVASTLNLNNVEIRGSSFSAYWSGGLDLTGAKFSKVSNLSILGQSGTPSAMSFGVKIESNGSSSEFYLDQLNVTFAYRGLWVTGGTAGAGNGPEGVYLEQSTLLSVNYGVDFNTGSSEPLLLVRGSHIAAFAQGIRSNALQSIVSDNLIYHRSAGAVGVFIHGLATDVAIQGNHFMSIRDPETSTSVVVDGPAKRVSVLNNTFNTATTGIWLRTGSSDSFVAQNVYSNVANKVVNSGTNNVILGWGAASP